MTFHQPDPNPITETAADRVREFLKQRSTMRGLDPQHIIAANEAVVTVGDLECLIQQADSLRYYNEHTHRHIEAKHVQALDGGQI